MESIRCLQPNEKVPLDLLLLADPELNVIENYLLRSKCYVLELDNKIIGVYLLLLTKPQTIEIVNIAVKESMQGKGNGRKLILHAIQTAREMKYKILQIGTGNSSIKQLALYQSCGFRITGIDKDFFIKHYSEPIFENGIQCRDMIRMEQEL